MSRERDAEQERIRHLLWNSPDELCREMLARFDRRTTEIASSLIADRVTASADETMTRAEAREMRALLREMRAQMRDDRAYTRTLESHIIELQKRIVALEPKNV